MHLGEIDPSPAKIYLPSGFSPRPIGPFTTAYKNTKKPPGFCYRIGKQLKLTQEKCYVILNTAKKGENADMLMPYNPKWEINMPFVYHY